MTRNTTKTPAEVAAELRARADRAELREAKATLQSNPTLAPLSTRLEAINKEIATLSRKLTGPQSFANRVKAIQLRATWIKAEQDYFTALDDAVRASKARVQECIDHYVKALHNGETVTAEEVSQAIASSEYEVDPALKTAMETAENAWRSFAKSEKNEATTAAGS